MEDGCDGDAATDGAVLLSYRRATFRCCPKRPEPSRIRLHRQAIDQPTRECPGVARAWSKRWRRGESGRCAAKAEDAIAHKTDDRNGDEHQGPRPQPDMVIHGIAKDDDQIQHERKVERGDQKARERERAERNSRPATGHESYKIKARHNTAKRDHLEDVALERVRE